MNQKYISRTVKGGLHKFKLERGTKRSKPLVIGCFSITLHWVELLIKWRRRWAIFLAGVWVVCHLVVCGRWKARCRGVGSAGKTEAIEHNMPMGRMCTNQDTHR